MIRDSNVDWMRKRLWVPAQGGLNTMITATGPTGAGTGAAPWVEVSTFDFSGIDCDNTDVYGFAFKLPYDVDPKYNLGFRWCYTSGETAASNIFTATTLVDIKANGAALVAATTALDTVVAAHTHPNIAFALNWTARGIKNKNFATREQIEAGAFLVGKATIALTGLATAVLLGLEMDYVSQMCRGIGNELDKMLTAQGAT